MNRALILLPLILLALLAGIAAGLLRTGMELPLAATAGHHGALMVGSFLGSVIFLERAVVMPSKWWLLLPAVNAASLPFFLMGDPGTATLLLLAGSAGFAALCIYFVYRFRELYYYVFAAGAGCLVAGNFHLWQGGNYGVVYPWWIAFLLFTIVAERLELSRFLELTALERFLLLLALGLVAAAMVWPLSFGAPFVLAGGLAAVALWLLCFDMARYAVKMGGQHRYSALLLIAGYAWLLVTALLLVAGSQLLLGYDAALHSFFIGFVFSMIFSHAPIILPAVARWPVKLFRPFLYLPFVLLQLTLLARIGADLAGDPSWRMWSAAGNGLSMLLFFASIGLIVYRERGRRRQLRNPSA